MKLCRDVTTILKMCMWFCREEQLIFDKITAFKTLTVQKLALSNMREIPGEMGQGLGIGAGHGGIIFVLQMQFSSYVK